MSAREAATPPGGVPTDAPEEARAIVRAFLSPEEEQAWFGLLKVHEELRRALEARLLAEHQMPLSAFQALMEIAHAEEGSISISELAERIHLSPSQVSRVAIDFERQGLVERQRSEADSRSTRVVITDAGRRQLQTVAPAYLSTVRSLLFAGLSERDVNQLVRIWNRIEAATPSNASRVMDAAR